jgi:hypothetical protein
MDVAVQLEFKTDRKEPPGTLVRRVAALFESNRLQPEIQASFSDGPAILRKTSALSVRSPNTRTSRISSGMTRLD